MFGGRRVSSIGIRRIRFSASRRRANDHGAGRRRRTGPGTHAYATRQTGAINNNCWRNRPKWSQRGREGRETRSEVDVSGRRRRSVALKDGAAVQGRCDVYRSAAHYERPFHDINHGSTNDGGQTADRRPTYVFGRKRGKKYVRDTTYRFLERCPFVFAVSRWSCRVRKAHRNGIRKPPSG